MKLKKILAIGLASAMALTTFACGGASSNTTTAAGGDAADTETKATDAATTEAGTNTSKTDETLVVSLSSEPASILGTIVGESDTNGCLMMPAYLDTLVNKDATTGEITPRLATEWEWLDSKRLEFTLRDDVYFTDGHKMTAADVLYTVQTYAVQAATGDAGRYLDAENSEAVDDTHVIIAFNTEAPDIISMLSWSIWGIISEPEVEAAGGFDAVADAPVTGTGRYIFKEWQQGQYVLFERNDNYWDTDYAGYYKQIKFVFASDGAAREMAIESGDAQVTCDLDVAQAATYKANNTKVTTYLTDYGQVYHLWFNMNGQHAAMEDANVRKAIDLALDYDAIAAYATGGYAEASLGYISSYVPFAADYYTTEERAQDLDQAKQLLSDAGYGDGLSLTCIGLADTTGLYTIIQQQLALIGIDLTINTTDTATFVQSVAFKDTADYDLVIVGEYLDSRNPSIFTFFRQANIDSFTIGGDKYTTPEIEAGIDAVIAAEDDAAAKEAVAALEELFKADTLVLNLAPQLKTIITATNIKGLTFRERGFMDVTTFYAE